LKSYFDYDDIVIIGPEATPESRPGAKAWVVGVFTMHPGHYFKNFPEGTVYSVEFEDGTSIEIHESYLLPFSDK